MSRFYSGDINRVLRKLDVTKIELGSRIISNYPGFDNNSAKTGTTILCEIDSIKMARMITKAVGVISHYPPASVDTSKTIYIEGDAKTSINITSNFSKLITDSTVQIATGVTIGKFITGENIQSQGNNLVIEIKGDIYIDSFKKNFVAWSNIGSVDFTIGRDNIAGNRPIDQKGWIYCVKKLGDKVIAYGENKVVGLVPAGNTFGTHTVYNLGIKGKNAVAGDETIHFFIDSQDRLWSLSNELELLDYSEFLNALSDPILTWDEKDLLLYLCDGNVGYVYNPVDKSLGQGYPNITGIAYYNGQRYVVASGDLSLPEVIISTDIIDMKTRKYKTITDIEIGTDLDVPMLVSIDYRLRKNEGFQTTPWKPLNPDGSIYHPCYGLEFKVNIMVETFVKFKIDYIKIKGFIHKFSFRDSLLEGEE